MKHRQSHKSKRVIGFRLPVEEDRLLDSQAKALGMRPNAYAAALVIDGLMRARGGEKAAEFAGALARFRVEMRESVRTILRGSGWPEEEIGEAVLDIFGEG